MNAEVIPLKDEPAPNFKTTLKSILPSPKVESQKRKGLTAASRSSCISLPGAAIAEKLGNIFSPSA
jgi:hypothetical protein